ncbi:hypothetical protein OC846_002911 [Tilletia horrida]|uniref:F-box domain-containing protein n=1 Tax=Tilletia horrida TaxID=155126 RepID=A0AAN6GRC6_9BASI|nr:hypothetical protein OC846_002911 [Tilletia horrida]
MSLSDLPNEVLDNICRYACTNGSGAALALASKRCREVAEARLYRHISIDSSFSLKLLVRSLTWRPELARHVRSLALYPASVPFDHACKLARLLLPYQHLFTSLQVRFPASDLPLALEFLETLNPTEFEWITSPTWMIRPGKLFQRFLTKWTRLKKLRLGNFFIDSVLAQSIASLPQITHLTLLGQSNKNLESESVRTLLEGVPSLTLLEVGDCPVRRRNIIEAELGIERDRGSHAPMIQRPLIPDLMRLGTASPSNQAPPETLSSMSRQSDHARLDTYAGRPTDLPTPPSSPDERPDPDALVQSIHTLKLTSPARVGLPSPDEEGGLNLFTFKKLQAEAIARLEERQRQRIQLLRWVL